MQIFLSWSGRDSRRAAAALKPWLERLVPGVAAWMSEHDLEAGTSWSVALHARLASARFGVLCVTSENLLAPWILYEAGALAVSSQSNCVVPYLLGVPADRLPAALAQFQSVPADRDGTWKLARRVASVACDPRPEGDLRAAFDGEWPALADALGLSVQLDTVGDIVVVALTNKQIASVEKMSALFQTLRSRWQAGQRKTVVDLSEVDMMPSGNGACVGLGFVLQLCTYARREDARVVFAGLTPGIVDLFTITKVIKLIDHCKSYDAALQMF